MGSKPFPTSKTPPQTGINMLFLVGGDGTQFAGNLLYEAARKRQLPVSIVGIPKSIDNESLAARFWVNLTPWLYVNNYIYIMVGGLEHLFYFSIYWE